MDPPLHDTSSRNLERPLLPWSEYVAKANTKYSTLGEVLHKLIMPWPIEAVNSSDKDPPKADTINQGDADASLSSSISAEEEKMLQEVKRGLEKANRIRQKAVTNLLPEVCCESAETDHGEAISEGLPNAEDSLMHKDVAMVNASVLKDLIHRHSKGTDSQHSNNFNQNHDKSYKKSPSKTLKPVNHRIQRVVDDGASRQAKSKVVVKLPKPVSAQRSTMYKTSSSEIGKRVRGHQSTGSSDKHRSDSSGKERLKARRKLENAPPDSNRPSSSGTVKAETVGEKQIRDRTRNVRGPGTSASKLAQATQFNSEKVVDMKTEANGLVAIGTTRNVTEKRVARKPDEMYGSKNSCSKLTVHDQDVSTPKGAAFELLKDGKSLEIPVSVKKLVSNNSKWRSKIEQCSKFKSFKAAGFLEKLGHLSEDEWPKFFISEMHREYKYLLDATSAVAEGIERDQEHGRISPEKLSLIDEQLKMIESRWSQLEHEREMLRIMNEGGERLKPLTGQSSRSAVRYETLKQLEMYVDLQLRIRIVEIQLKVEQALATTLLPLLKDLDPQAEQSLRIYRQVEGLLHHGGELFPSLVRFSDSDEDITSDEESALVDDFSTKLSASGVT